MSNTVNEMTNALPAKDVHGKAIKKAKMNTPQTKRLPGTTKKEMKKNHAGGFSFVVNDWTAYDRYLIMGVTDNFYFTADKSAKECVKILKKCLTADPERYIDRAVEISVSGRSFSNDQAIFALAFASAQSAKIAQLAFAKLKNVCRIGTHLFKFVSVFNDIGKWRNYAKKAVADWYQSKTTEQLSYQLLKYQNRYEWTNRDVLRLSHATPRSDEMDAMFNWVCNGGVVAPEKKEHLPEIFNVYDQIHRNCEDLNQSEKTKLVTQAIEKYNLSWEMLPTDVLKIPAIWEALLPKMPLTAMIRNLGRMTAIEVITPLSNAEKIVVQKLEDEEFIKHSRIHPVSVLAAWRTYSQGHGDKGSLIWKPSQRVIAALEHTFYKSFNYVKSTGENHMLAIDCSGSMFSSSCCGLGCITSAEAAGVMAMATAKKEPNSLICGFSSRYNRGDGIGEGIKELNINANDSLDKVLKVIRSFDWGGTDCSLPMLYALKNKIEVDKFCVYTDNETYAGLIHPSEALKQYRHKHGTGKLLVIATSVTKFSIADPNDAGMMDIAGFDSNIPTLIADF